MIKDWQKDTIKEVEEELIEDLSMNEIDGEVMARKKYSCDFETTTDETDCRVWIWGACELYDLDTMKYDNNIESFIDWCRMANGTGYFHNLRFDGEFIVNWLLRNGYTHSDSGADKTFTTVISAMGQWYKIDICFGYVGKKKQHMEMYDSLKKLPFPVKNIATGFNLDILKGDIDYHTYRGENHTPTEEELAYLGNDIRIVGQALEVQLDQGLKKITNGSDALSDFKDTIEKKTFDNYFPILDLALDKQIRKAYRGGFTWLNPDYAEKDVENGLVYDVNSLYPSVMRLKMLPIGIPVGFTGEYKKDVFYPLFIQEVRMMFEIKDGFMPTIQIKNNSRYFKENEYLKSSDGMMVEMSLTNIDLDMIRKHYDIYEVEYVRGWKFQERSGIFDNYIDKWTLVKTTSKGAVKLLAKLMLNSLYGKFATNPKVTGKIPYLKEDMSTGYRNANGEWKTKEDGTMKWVLSEDLHEYRDPVYTPMGVFITSWARHVTITSAQKNFPERLIYVDTDSQHLVGWEVPKNLENEIHESKLGYWKLENKFKRGRFLRQKTYIEEVSCADVKVSLGMLVTYPFNGKRHKIVGFTDETITIQKVIKNGKYYLNTKSTRIEVGKKDAFYLDVKCAGMPAKVKENVTWEIFRVGFTSSGKLLPKHVKGGVVLKDSYFTIK